MRISNKDLKKALNFIRQKKYSQAIRYLEPKVPIFLEDQNYYYLLAIACFHTNDLGGANFYLERGISIDPSNLDLRLMMSVVQLKRKSTTAAAKSWLTVLEYDPENRMARKGLEKIRKLEDKADLNLFLEKKKYRPLMPSLGFHIRNIIPWFLLLLFISALAIAGFHYIPQWLDSRDDPQREELNYVDMELRENSILDNSGSFTYLLTRDEVEKSYEKVIHYYDNFRDNLAQKEVNRLLNSNASEEIKSKVALLQGYFRKPDYMDFYTDYTYSQAIEEPLLYQNCYVLWTGRVSNVKVEEEKIEFLFLVGFEDETNLEGIMPAYIERAVNLQTEMAVEILGRLELENKKLKLKVETIRHIIAEE